MMNNLIINSIKKSFARVIEEIQKDFPYYTPTNIDLDKDNPSFELNGFRYEFFGADSKWSNAGLTISDNGLMSITYNKYVEGGLDFDKENHSVHTDPTLTKNNYMLKHRLILTDAAFRLYKKIKKRYPDKSIIPSVVKENDDKIRIKYDDHAIFTINLNWKYNNNDDRNGEKYSMLYNNIQYLIVDMSNSTVDIKIDTVEIDLKLKDLKMLFNNLDYLYDTVIEPLLDERLYFMDQKIEFKHKTTNVKKAIESSNFVRKMKINSVLGVDD